MKDDNRSPLKGIKNFTVSEIREKRNGFINPVIVTFQNGEITQKHASECKVTLTPQMSGRTRAEINTSYNHVFKEAIFNERVFHKQILAIRNKKTNKVKLVEVDNAVLINSAMLQNCTPEEITSEKEYSKDIRTLHKTFGGKKIITRLEQRERLNLSSLPIADEVKKVVEDIKVEDNISINDTEINSIIHLLPPCHREAKVLSDVYVLNEILTEDELNALKAELESLEKSKDRIKGNTEFFNDCLIKAEKVKENLENRKAAILFVEYIIKFLKIPIKKVVSETAVLCKFSSLIRDKLLNEFCIKTETSLTRPMTMRDKCFLYIIALSLIACNFELNVLLLSSSTKGNFSRLCRLARVAGAVPISKEGTFYSLKLPLPELPKSYKGKSKRK